MYLDDDDHEYQVIPDSLNEYNNQALSHSSKASTGSSLGTRSKGSDTVRWPPNSGWGHPWGKQNSVHSQEMITFSSPGGYNDLHHNASSRVSPENRLQNPSSSKFSLRSGSRSHSPQTAPPLRYSNSPQGISSTSNSSSTPTNQFNSHPYYSPVPESQNHSSSNHGSEFSSYPHQTKQNERNLSSFKSSNGETYPPVFSSPVDPKENQQFSSFVNGKS